MLGKQDCRSKRSREHVIPESLGNRDHVLPPGVVCDSCNNYFARKIEKPLIEHPFFRDIRHQAGIGNKCGRIPALRGFYVQACLPTMLGLADGNRWLEPEHERDAEQFATTLRMRSNGTLMFVKPEPPTDAELDRFFGKVALEVLALRALAVPGGLEEIVHHPDLDDLRSFVRYGSRHKRWDIARRQLYAADTLHSDGSESFAIAHEFDLLYTNDRELYFVMALFGEEFVINMGEPTLDGYVNWLRRNGGASPLHVGANASFHDRPASLRVD